jgi:hypothetical protein
LDSGIIFLIILLIHIYFLTNYYPSESASFGNFNCSHLSFDYIHFFSLSRAACIWLHVHFCHPPNDYIYLLRLVLSALLGPNYQLSQSWLLFNHFKSWIGVWSFLLPIFSAKYLKLYLKSSVHRKISKQRKSL